MHYNEIDYISLNEACDTILVKERAFWAGVDAGLSNELLYRRYEALHDACQTHIAHRPDVLHIVTIGARTCQAHELWLLSFFFPSAHLVIRFNGVARLKRMTAHFIQELPITFSWAYRLLP